ncbi:Pls/PosA family non-ribosomal peptide synthetase [Geodermatophilus sp. URMC 65]
MDLVSAGAGSPAPAADPVVTGYTAVLAEVLSVEAVDPDAHVFEDLGADSMVMARFCARVRKDPGLPAASIKDVYQHPTLRGLAGALAPAPVADPVLTGFAAVLADVLQVDSVEPDAHVFEDLGADSMVMARFCARVRKDPGLPTVSIKDVYAHPTLRALAGALAPAPAAASPVQDGLAAVLADVLQVDSVDPDAHVFEDLGADSMVMARFCARVRKDPGLPAISIKDVYAHPTLRGLAAAVAEPVPAVAEPAEAAPAPAPEAPARTVRRATSVEYVLCGILQALFFLGYCMLVASVGVAGYGWISEGEGVVDLYARSVLFGGATFVGLSLLPIVAKWVLIGRWKPQQFPVWSPAYVRFWIVKTLVQRNPMLLLFTGTPLYPWYLRALGAKVGRDVAIFTKVPVCTDLLTIGDGTVIRKDAQLSGYRAHDGLIQTGRVTFGRDVVVGEASVIDIETSMGDGAQLGHRSSLHAGQAVPAGESWHGAPARRADVDYRLVRPMRVSSRRKVVYSALKLCTVLLLDVPLAIGGVALLFLLFPGLAALLETGPLGLTSATFYLDALVGSLVLYFGSYLVGFLFVTTVPRVLSPFITPGKVYPLYGFHYSVQRTITKTTNGKPLLRLTGNSSYVVHYLKAVGYHLGRVVQTGSNFGEAVKHDNPYLTSVGSGTMVADGLSVTNAEFSNTSFQVSRASIGAHSFLGNAVAYPAEARVGDDVLLATKVMVPIDGEVRQGVGLLGSPAFEIPRTVSRDATIDAHLQAPGELARRLAAKNRHNLRAMGLFLLLHWVNFFAVTLITLVGFDLHNSYGYVSIAAAMVLDLLLITFFGVLVERASTGFRPLAPQQCSIYDPYFWWHERYWKLVADSQPKIYNGTPFKNVLWRVLGVRIGRRVFDDGASIPERTLVTIGDGCTLNAGTTIQAHSQEDGGFKSDRITIGAGVTLGVGSWVHYGVTMGDGAELGPDAFLMKGSDVLPGEHWGGNPAEEMPQAPAAPPPREPSTPTAAVPTPRPNDTSHSLEELMDLFQEDDGAPGPSSTPPLPRRSGRHRTAQRHRAGSR